MYNNVFETASEEIETIRSIIKVHEKLRELQSVDTRDLPLLVTELIEILPKRGNWTVYEHCSVITRLYSIYESFVESIIHEWIDRLPLIVMDYSQLDEIIRRSHAANIGNLLTKMCNRKDGFEDTLVKDTLEGLYQGVSGNRNYQLLRDAFSGHEQNLRKDILEELFREAGIHDHCWAWVQKHPKVIKIITEKESTEARNRETETRLKDFIQDRNEAAHGKVTTDKSSLLNNRLLLELCDFVEVVCLSLSELVRYKTLDKQKQYNLVQQIGKIKRFRDKIQVAEVIFEEDINILVGEEIYLIRDGDCSECQIAIIENIRIDGIDRQDAAVNSNIKVEIKLNIFTKEKAKIYRSCK
jgi:MAE_28990/MAE_18760-like HEPN